MKIAIYGAGGVGGYFGGCLAQAGADVHLIARGDHLDALRQDGLRVENLNRDFEIDAPATDDPTDIGPCDYVLFTVKSNDTKTAATHLDPLLKQDTAVISLQNGIDNEEQIAAEIGQEHVMGGVAYILSFIDGPGVVAQNQRAAAPSGIVDAQFVFGELDGSRTQRAERFLELCDQATGMEAVFSDDIRSVIWEKAAFICAHAGMTAGTRLPLGDIRAIAESWEMYRGLLTEACAVARAAGVDLADDTVERWMAVAAELDADAYSSLHYDLTNDKPMELEALHGAVGRRAREHDVNVPMNEAVYALLKPWAERNQRTQDRSGDGHGGN